ncbi:sarcosine oxidase subunit delta [Neosynechococcus sphagnicola]|uniref:sarcosine oxidase subunit delta n=1 Tax=Neosynechococcus sphagnicola TaxID=1501145 RepID=UPI0009077C9C|nr:sarcosine oxidase subunit delta [Neosynechococcus sphagnicola]
MKLITCPIHGARPIAEFIYGGAIQPMPDPHTTDNAAWADYVFNRQGAPGVQSEWWCHTPSNTWFIADRDTQSDIILRTYLFTGGMGLESVAKDTAKSAPTSDQW